MIITVRLTRLNNSESGENVSEVRADLQNAMQLYFGVFRGEHEKGLKILQAIGERIQNLHLIDKSITFNTARIEALELEICIRLPMRQLSAEARTESRGAHARSDYQERDDKQR